MNRRGMREGKFPESSKIYSRHNKTKHTPVTIVTPMNLFEYYYGLSREVKKDDKSKEELS